MAWIVLLASAVLEAVWATALGASEGLSEPAPTVVFAVATAASMAGLAMAVRRIPLATAYAVWVGVGASLTVGWAMLTSAEAFSWPKLVFIAGIVACSAGLKALSGGGAAVEPGPAPGRPTPGRPGASR